jgi:hypothetical protein
MNFDEYDIVQNSGLCAMTLHQFVSVYISAHAERSEPPLPLCLCILPIALHDETSSLLCNRRPDGGLFNARAEDRTLGIGLQERIMDMNEISLEALKVGLTTGLLTYSTNAGSVSVGHITKLNYRPQKGVARIFQTARRLGHWFATRPLAETCALLRISL